MVQGPTTLYNAVRVDTATTGQGDITLGNATSDAFLDYTEAGVADETVVTYLAEDGDNFELGRGLYDADYSIQQRDTILVSKISGTAGTAKLTLSGSATVRIVAAAEDFMPYFGDSQPSTPHTLWVRTTDFALFCYYDSATPPGQPGVYVQIGGGAGSLATPFIDSNGNEWLDVSATASAVNYLEITNAATGNGPTISAVGDDTNIDLNISPKGSGVLNLDFGSANSTLDDYEEGTFTPNFGTDGTGFTTVTYNTQLGYYVKIGNLVYIGLKLDVATLTVGSASGSLEIESLPFTSRSGSWRHGSFTISTRNNFTTNEPDGARIQDGRTTIDMCTHPAGSNPSFLSYTELTSSSEIQLTGCYEAD